MSFHRVFSRCGCFFVVWVGLVPFLKAQESAPPDKGIRVQERQAEDWLKGRRHALIVGISDYKYLRPQKDDPKGQDEAYDLEYADDDARAVERLLRDDLKYDNVTCLQDSQATRDGILEAFKDLTNAAKPFDTVFVFISGHGFKREKKTYFMPYDAKLNILKHHGIALDEVFTSDPRSCAADHKLLVLDCCHSGGATSKAVEVAGNQATFSESELRDLSGKGLYVLTACKKDEVAYEDEKSGQGYFTRIFLEALKDGKADTYRKGNQDGLVSGDEIYYYLFDHLPETIRHEKGRGAVQTPQRDTPETGETFIARVGKLFRGEVVFRLKSIPGGAKVLINDAERGSTPANSDVPMDTTLELGQEQRILAQKDGFLPWKRTLNPQKREPVELTAVLLKEGQIVDQRFDQAVKLYEKGRMAGALDNLESLIEDDSPDAPKALLFLSRDHFLKNGKTKEADEKANFLRQKYGAFDESAQADLALYQHASGSLDSKKPEDRPLAWHQALIAALQDFLKRQPENRHAEEAKRRVDQAQQAIRSAYLDSYNKLVERFQGDLDDGEFESASRRLQTATEKLDEATKAGFALEIPQERQIPALRQRMTTRQKEVAEDKAYREALRADQGAKDPDEKVKTWEGFLNAFPNGKSAAEAKDFLAKARQDAKAWHDGEYAKAMREATEAKEAKDYSKASEAVQAALRHRPNDAAALALQKQLIPTLVIASTPPGAALQVSPQPDSRNLKPETPTRIEVQKHTAYTVTFSKKGFRSVTKDIRVTEGGDYEINVTLEESKLPPGLEEAFEIPSGPKDAYGNPVRQGFDEKTGNPLELRHKATGMHLVFIPAGSFDMESNEVTLTQWKYMAKYEVTQAEWQKAMGENPSNFKGGTNPVECVSWEDCENFFKKLNAQMGVGKAGYRFALPTEAEWEYACRAGTTTRFSFGDRDDGLDEHAWYSGNAGSKTHPVGGKKANPWGLYDMHGNVWEWCEDWYGKYEKEAVTDPKGPTGGRFRVYRGGGWCNFAADCRSAVRNDSSPGDVGRELGCRLVVRSSP